MVFENCILCILGKQQLPGSVTESGIFTAVKDSTKLSMTKNVFNSQMETTITAEKDCGGFKRSSTDLWPNYGYLKQQACDFSVEKANMPEKTAFYINQAYLSYKDNKKNILLRYICPWSSNTNAESSWRFEKLYTKGEIVRPKYDVLSGQFLRLVETLGYLTVCGDECWVLFWLWLY